jgi:hypothetical protein
MMTCGTVFRGSLVVARSLCLGQGDVRQVSVNGQCDVILLAVRPSGRRPENKLRPSLPRAENWLNESDIVVGTVRKLRRWH